MKLRIHNNSVRMRLGKGEVAQLAAAGRVEARLDVGAGEAFLYSLSTDPQVSAISAVFANCELKIVVPQTVVHGWASGSDVTISAEQGSLAILIEKDFHCLHRDPTDGDAYPNPLLQSAR